jgi:hypothetical protein
MLYLLIKYYYIVKLNNNSSDDIIIFIPLYAYDINTSNLIKQDTPEYNYEIATKNNYNILYKSNILQNCLDNINIITNSNKYNI